MIKTLFGISAAIIAVAILTNSPDNAKETTDLTPKWTVNKIIAEGVEAEDIPGYYFTYEDGKSVWTDGTKVLEPTYASPDSLNAFVQKKVKQRHLGYPVDFKWGYDYKVFGLIGDAEAIKKEQGRARFSKDYSVTNAFGATLNFTANVLANGTNVIEFTVSPR